MRLSNNLETFLTRLLSPPDPIPNFDGAMPSRLGDKVTVGDFATWDLASLPDSALVGAIVYGEASPDQAADLFRAVEPGGYVAIVCNSYEEVIKNVAPLEDEGFDIKDSILIPEDDGEAVYEVSKPGPKEKSRGPAFVGLETNSHCTIKPEAVMDLLVKPFQGGTVVDPFMGSGTTGVAAVRHKCSFTGIDLDNTHVGIAEGRVKALQMRELPFEDVDIESEFMPTSNAREYSLDDLL